MNIIECDESEIFKRKQRTNTQRLLTNFQQSGKKCARLADHGYCSVKCCATTLNQSAKRYNVQHIKAVIRGDDVFLINTLLVKED